MSLPSWPGASVVYDRALRMLEYMSRDAHTAFRNRKNPRKRDVYHVPEIVRETIVALDRGDEETIKAFVGNPQHDRYFKEALEEEQARSLARTQRWRT